MRRLVMGSLILVGWLLSAFRAAPQAEGELQPLEPEYTFGNQVTFRVRLLEGVAVSEVWVLFQSQGDTSPQQIAATSTAENEYSATFSVSERPLRAFALVTYWFVAKTPSGQQVSSPKMVFRYEDNAADRRTLEDPPFRIRWYEGDDAFAQTVLTVAHQSLEQLQARLGASPPAQINIYVYANALDLQTALRLGHVTWMSGHADADLGVMVVSLPAGPEQRPLVQQLIPHELSHILLYQLVGAQHYRNIPTWLNEGLASVAELSPNPDYERILKRAKEKDAFIPLSSLCQGFPLDASGAFLAYAEAEWFTRYLTKQYGEAGLQALLAAYAGGLDCERAPEVALGKPLSEIERQWLQEQWGVSAAQTALEAMIPWMSLLALALAAPAVAAWVGERRRGAHGGG